MVNIDIKIKTLIKNKKLLRELSLYGIIGLVCALLDGFSFKTFKTLGLNIYFANFLGMNIGMVLSFLLNAFINFKVRGNLLKRALSFFAIGYCGILLSMGILFLGCKILNFDEIIIKVVSIIIVAGFQFILNRSITFKSNRKI